MDPEVIARNIRQLRETRHWTQEELATASGVDPRTVQRAEAGEKLGLSSLKAISAAFDTTIEDLSLSQEQFSAMLEDFRKKFKIIDVQPVTRGSELSVFFTNVEASQFERVGDFTDDQLDAIAEFESDVRGWLEIGSDITPLLRREAERSLDNLLAVLRHLNVAVSIGEEQMKLKAGDRPAFELRVLYIAISPGERPLHALVREKTNARVSFA